MKKIIPALLLFISINAHCQNIVFVKDSIMNSYMKSGFSNKNFRPEGKTDENKLRQGPWKDYKVEKDYMYLTVNGITKQVYGVYLVYGEGTYHNDKRTGGWKFYAIEDKTFKRILQKEATYKNGFKEGNFTYFLPTGTKASKGTYSVDMMNGACKNYYESGALHWDRTYEMGMLNGPYTFYYENGRIKSEGTYYNNIQNGKHKVFYPNGQLQEIYGVQMGKEHGIYQYYYANGQLWIEKEYENGLLMNVKCNYTASGVPRDNGTLKNGNGTIIYYNEEGSVYNTETYKDGKLVSNDKKLPEPNFRN